MATVSAKTGILLALLWTCLVLSFQARASGPWESATARAPEHRFLIPAMKADAFSGGRAILISGSGVESVRLGDIPRQWVPAGHLFPARRLAAGLCIDYADIKLNSPEGSE